MRWSKMLAHWVPRVRGPRRQVFVAGVKVWILRHGWNPATTAGPVIALAFALSCDGQMPSSSPPPQPPPAPAPRFVVVLDAAHGGDDTGAHLDSGQLEKTADLALSVRLRSLLAARGISGRHHARVRCLPRPRQARGARQPRQRGRCLSLHATESGSGVHLFASSLAPAQSTRFLAWKTAQAAWITRSLALAGS